MYITITAPVMQFIFDWQQHYTGPPILQRVSSPMPNRISCH
ncbi:predicted protein [Plenodomus lingam JN3]|uniref:Uncharacterized protein n=1 Tax=Leptosphaeria maculans (strain JN3 / isolate v23.1.3 / race Av1-4-5-6-7-8) TaxID=985895 RepID=E4ZG34_LEPMJ|nr:predicted protein [Plenodomus lingam JN3]CBX90254.1 predicted protein [Plenodomus lingam JN3]